MKAKSWILEILFLAFVLPPVAAAGRELPLHTINLPRGFSISLFAEGVTNARSLLLSPKGTLFVGSTEAGKVYAHRDENEDSRADRVYTIAKGLSILNGVAFRNGSLFVTEVSRFDDIENRLANLPASATLSIHFLANRAHGWKFIRFGPDGKLYVLIGASCNVRHPSQSVNRVQHFT